MLSEEALIFLAGLAALGGVALSALELLWPTKPRHPVRRTLASSDASTAAPSTPLAPPVPVAPPAPVGPPPVVAPIASVAARRRWRSNRPRHAMNGSRNPYRRRHREPVTAEAAGAFDGAPPRTLPAAPAIMPLRVAIPTVSPSPKVPPPAVEPAPLAVAPDVDADVVDRCFALYQERAYPAVVAAATPAIVAHAAAGRAADVARLWSIMALAQQAMEECVAARAALQAAIAAAPGEERPTYLRQLATLAGHAAQILIVRAEGVRGPSSEEDLRALREALDWLECGAAAAPGDLALRDRAADVERRLWPTCERVVMTLVQRQQYEAARRLLREALDDPRFPAARADTFRELFSGTYGGEIGQLTAQAIRSMHDAREAEALGALERAEHLLDTIHDEALPPKRREEVDRRLWWGYKKLGRRRAQAGEYEAAAGALFHALRFAGVGTDRQADTRAALVRVLEGLVEKRALRIRELAESGDREAVVGHSDALWSCLRGAIADGLAEEDLAVAFAKAQRVFDEVGVRQ